MLPVIKPAFIPSAPVSPVSSSRVKTHSIGPCSMLSESRMASSIAHPIPSSAPSVVPLAFIHSPSTYVCIGSFSKSIFTSGSFSQTMSMWLCRIIVGRPSIPFVAFFLISTLPVSSTLVSNPLLSPNWRRYSIIFSSFLEGLGIALIFANCSKTHAGFSSIFAILVIFYSFLCVIVARVISFFTTFATAKLKQND